jgi:AmmeMemoRadiSam system protein B
MLRKTIAAAIILALASVLNSAAQVDSLAIRQALDGVGIKPSDGMRGQMDIVGYASTAEQMTRVLEMCAELAQPRQSALDAENGWNDDTAFIAAVCPHDDYCYSGRLYALALPRIRAKRVIVFGVFHKARLFDCHDRLVFDSYRSWHGPFGPVAVSPVRDAIIQRLPAEDIVQNNDMQMIEHSVEGIVNFLQAYDRDVEIVSILVPYMGWETMDRLAGDLARAIASIISENGWQLGRDIAFVCSTDAVHYGDSEWGGQNYAEFGTDAVGYLRAVERDRELANTYLSGEVKPAALEDFLYQCVDSDNVREYKITWCGRFSVPFGLDVVSRLTETLAGRPLTGFLLDYGTSVSEASLNLDGLDGMGVTAPNNFHHFVGYAALGYR